VLVGKGPFFKTNLCLFYGTAIKTLADALLILVEPADSHSKSSA
jgi:hypothetical protein